MLLVFGSVPPQALIFVVTLMQTASRRIVVVNQVMALLFCSVMKIRVAALKQALALVTVIRSMIVTVSSAVIASLAVPMVNAMVLARVRAAAAMKAAVAPPPPLHPHPHPAVHCCLAQTHRGGLLPT